MGRLFFIFNLWAIVFDFLVFFQVVTSRVHQFLGQLLFRLFQIKNRVNHHISTLITNLYVVAIFISQQVLRQYKRSPARGVTCKFFYLVTFWIKNLQYNR